MNDQLVTSMAAVIGLVVLICAVIMGFDRRLLLVEYGWKTRRCPACGRACFGRRSRAAPNERWEGWKSECCNEPLD